MSAFHIVEYVAHFHECVKRCGLSIEKMAKQMGTLVKTAEALENRVGLMRREFEPKVRFKLKEAKAEWSQVRNRNGSLLTRTEVKLKAFILKTEGRLRYEIDKLIAKMIVELKKARRRTLPRGV